MFADGLVDGAAVRAKADGIDWLQALCEPFTPEATAAQTGIDPASVRALARDLVRTPRAAVYGRLGTCVGRYGTLTAYLIDAVNLVAGNLDAPGGSVFGLMHTVGQRWQNTMMGVALRRIVSAQAVAHRRHSAAPSAPSRPP